MYDVWKNQEVLDIVSSIAGVDLVPCMDFEIAHINLSMQTEEQKETALKAIAEKTSRDLDEGVSGCPWEDDDAPIVDWHTDSYPFVCVTMLSDCTNMIGGETALRTGNGDIMKVRGPQMVSRIRKALMIANSLGRVALSSFKGDTLSIKLSELWEPQNVSRW